MERIFSRISVKLIFVILVGSLLVFAGCSDIPVTRVTEALAGNDFSIRVMSDAIPSEVRAARSDWDWGLDETHVIVMDDIIEYVWETHQIVLTPEAFQHISELTVSTFGRPFAVCIDDTIIYRGFFYVMYSSQLFPGVTIMQPFGDPLVFEGRKNTISIKYVQPPSLVESQWTVEAEDPRDDERIMDTLERAGKLK